MNDNEDISNKNNNGYGNGDYNQTCLHYIKSLGINPKIGYVGENWKDLINFAVPCGKFYGNPVTKVA